MNESKKYTRWIPLALLITALIVSIGLKLAVVDVGAPYVTIDDVTQYEGGFLVWYGQSPPQRTHIESWLNGLVSLATYTLGRLAAGEMSMIGVNLIADAYVAFYVDPDRFVATYRTVALLMDLLTAVLVFLLGRTVFDGRQRRDLLAALAAAFYLCSFNTIWCFVVARPDTATALLATLGVLLYYRSRFGARLGTFWLAAFVLGLAAGMKLHAAFFTIFFALDLLRVHGWREAWPRLWPFCLIALGSFAVSAGSPLFDPLLYVKLRVMNYYDDLSPWLRWGDQFVAMLRGTGWLILPLALYAIWNIGRREGWRSRSMLASLAFLAICWLVLFSTIRVLRPYWMLPVLPLFYIIAADALSRLRYRLAMPILIAAILTILTTQSVQQMLQFKQTPYNELRTWVRDNVAHTEVMYILGYEALELPRNHVCLDRIRSGLEYKIADTADQGESFTRRHVVNWEERARLVLLDMLTSADVDGFTYFGYNLAPIDRGTVIVDPDEIDYFLLQRHFSLTDKPDIAEVLARDFHQVAEVTGPGGGGRGLSYLIFARK